MPAKGPTEPHQRRRPAFPITIVLYYPAFSPAKWVNTLLA